MSLTLLPVCTVRTKHGAQPRPHDDVITFLSTSVFGLFVKKNSTNTEPLKMKHASL